MQRSFLRRKAFRGIPAAGLLLFSASAWGQISLVHVTSCGPGAFPGTTCTIPATGSGHLIVVGWQMSGATSTTIQSVADNAGNTYMEAGAARSIDTVAGTVADIWYAKNSRPGATSVTITPSSNVTNGLVVLWEFSGVDATAPLDRTATLNSQAATVAPSGAAVTSTAAGEVLISLAVVAQTVTGIYPGNPFTNDSTLQGNGWAHLITSSSGTYSAQWNQSPAGTYGSSTASFKAAGSSAGGACDVNQDAAVNVLDVQVATNMYLGSSPCTVTMGGVAVCNVAFVNVVTTAAMGGACVTPVLSDSPSSISFGTVVIGNSSKQTVTLTNTGTGTVTVSNVTVTGAGFSISGLSLPLTLGAGQSGTFSVTFAPTVAGSVTGNLAYASTALNAPTNQTLSGSGVVNSHSVSLNWTASTSVNVVGYNVYRGTVSGGPYTKVNSALVAGTSYTDSAVQAGLTYYYVATAVDNHNNESAYSNQARAVVPVP